MVHCGVPPETHWADYEKRSGDMNELMLAALVILVVSFVGGCVTGMNGWHWSVVPGVLAGLTLAFLTYLWALVAASEDMGAAIGALIATVATVVLPMFAILASSVAIVGHGVGRGTR
jgi:hypothetical protein